MSVPQYAGGPASWEVWVPRSLESLVQPGTLASFGYAVFEERVDDGVLGIQFTGARDSDSKLLGSIAVVMAGQPSR